jgi:glycosyltransferase involved in cell wall biosynthesis
MPSRSEPLVSVVTAAYNEEHYLSQCIESVLSQDYENWQYIIANNRSTDRTLEIAMAYASRDPRIHVYDDELFVSGRANMNRALSRIAAHSKYCKMVGADDWIYPGCIRQMVDIAEASPTVSIVGSYWISGADAGPVQPLPLGMPQGVTVLPGREMCRAFLLGGHYQFGTPTSLLYRADIVRSRAEFFEEAFDSADVEVCLTFLNGWDFGFVPQILTFNRIRAGSAYDAAKRRGEEFQRDLVLLKRFGDQYLAPDELRSRARQVLKSYYQYLGSRVYDRAGREFWDFHDKNLRAFGRRINWPRLAASALVYGAKAGTRRFRRAVGAEAA